MSSVSKEPANPYAPPQAEVQHGTRDNTDGIPQLASLGERLGAFVLDTLIYSVLIFVPLFISVDWQALFAALGAEEPDAAPDLSGILAAFGLESLAGMAVGVLIWLGLNLYFVVKNSQSPGKKLIGIKVARTDGSHASLGRIFWLRNVVNALPPLIPFVGYFYGLIDHLCIFHESRKCLHDRIADTIVIKA